MNTTPSEPNYTITVVDTDTVLDDWFDKNARDFLGSKQLEILKKSVKGMQEVRND